MVAVNVWLGGEGPNELGTDDEPGCIEALLRRVEPEGWRVDGKTTWKRLRKYRTGGAREPARHRDARNAQRLCLIAWEHGCEVLAFTRDVDADDEREDAIETGIDASKEFAIQVIGGTARPNIEGWILAVLGVAHTDEMSRLRVERELGERHVPTKDRAAYVCIIEAAAEPLKQCLATGCESLGAWLARAETVLGPAIRGSAHEPGSGGPP